MILRIVIFLICFSTTTNAQVFDYLQNIHGLQVESTYKGDISLRSHRPGYDLEFYVHSGKEKIHGVDPYFGSLAAEKLKGGDLVISAQMIRANPKRAIHHLSKKRLVDIGSTEVRIAAGLMSRVDSLFGFAAYHLKSLLETGGSEAALTNLLFKSPSPDDLATFSMPEIDSNLQGVLLLQNGMVLERFYPSLNLEKGMQEQSIIHAIMNHLRDPHSPKEADIMNLAILQKYLSQRKLGQFTIVEGDHQAVYFATRILRSFKKW